MVVQLKRNQKWLPRKQMTYEQFLDWADEDTYAEWVDGEVELMSPASVPHQDLSVFITRLFAQYIEDKGYGKVLPAPFQMKLANVLRGREPDVLFITDEHLSRLQRNYLDGPADIAVEIASPESILRDRGAKYGEYEAGGVREYWVIDNEARRADFFVLGDDGAYERVHPNGDGIYRSAVLPEFWLNVNWLWEQPLPTLRRVLQEWEKSR